MRPKSVRVCLWAILVMLQLGMLGCGRGRPGARMRPTPTAEVSLATPAAATVPLESPPTPTSVRSTVERQSTDGVPAVTPTVGSSGVSEPSGTASPLPSATKVPSISESPRLPSSRQITANDFIPEQLNSIDTIVVMVDFSGRPDESFDLGQHLQRIFGQDDPHTQLNAYYRENFYGQLELRPHTTPEMGSKGYVEVELDGSLADYPIGFLVAMGTEDLPGVDVSSVQRLMLDVMTKVVEKHGEVDYQDKYVIVVLNAFGYEYGRGAIGALPTGGVNPVYDLFITETGEGDIARFSDPAYFRTVGDDRVIGVIDSEGYTFDDYFRDRGQSAWGDDFIMGMAIFGRDAPLSCASHDILHGLRRKSAYAVPPEGRSRAINCLYNLQLQDTWLVGTEEAGHSDRSINCSPYIGWWDPMGDHLHTRLPREFFSSHPHGMSAFTKLRMGLIPERCLAVVDSNDAVVRLAPLSSAELPRPGSEAESIAIKVPLAPGNESLAHIYLLLEYRRRVGTGPDDFHPDNFRVDPDHFLGDKTRDPGYDPANPAGSRYINPPTQFVTDEGVLVYLVNEKMPEAPGLPYTEWYNFVIALLNPEGNENRDDLTRVAMDAGELMEVDFRVLYPERGVPIVITISVEQRSEYEAVVRIARERV